MQHTAHDTGRPFGSARIPKRWKIVIARLRVEFELPFYQRESSADLRAKVVLCRKSCGDAGRVGFDFNHVVRASESRAVIGAGRRTHASTLAIVAAVVADRAVFVGGDGERRRGIADGHANNAFHSAVVGRVAARRGRFPENTGIATGQVIVSKGLAGKRLGDRYAIDAVVQCRRIYKGGETRGTDIPHRHGIGIE